MKPLSDRHKSALLIAGLLLSSITMGLVFSPKDGYFFPEPLKAVDEKTTDLHDRAITADESFQAGDRFSSATTNFRDRKMEIDETFTSNLPLVILDTGRKRPPQYSNYDEGLGYAVRREHIDPFVEGEISLIDTAKSTNRLTDNPVVSSKVRLRRRGNSSEHYDKHQYLLKLVDESGRPNRQNILGMGADDEWILNISFIDKSLLRNYLAYTAAGEIMPYAPDAKFCELVFKDGDTYQYEGLYLMLESVNVGKDRVPLPAFSENAQYLPALLRRDRYNPEGILLDNYASKYRLLYGYLEVKWPNASVLTQDDIVRITEQINPFEEALFAKDYGDFIKYRDYVDLDSFTDYFIINEFFINYDAGRNSTYMYFDYSGKLRMGPVWDFDGAMDNYKLESANFASTAFHNAPWFLQMLRDPAFANAIINRYHALRQSILSDKSIQSFIDQTVTGLGPAIDRDWARWGYFYAGSKYLQESYENQPDRNTKTHAEEIAKLKYVLSTHGNWLDTHLDSLYQFADPDAPTPQENLPQ